MNGTRIVVGALAAAALSAAAVAATAAGAEETRPGYKWNDGPLATSGGFVFSIFGSRFEIVTSSSAGFETKASGKPPIVGQVFYIRGTTGNVSSGSSDAPIMDFFFDEMLDPDIDVAVGNGHSVRCFFRPAFDQPWQDAEFCTQRSTPGANGLFFGGRPTTPGETMQIQVPVMATKGKSGPGDGPKSRFGVAVSSSIAATRSAEQFLTVADPRPRATGVRVQRRRRLNILHYDLPASMNVKYSVQRRMVTRGAASLNAGIRWRTVRRYRAKDRDEGDHQARLGRFRPGRYRALLQLTSLSGKKGTAGRTFRAR